MNTIRNYLDNMFLRLPQTDEVKRAKKELLAMMEDKYNELKSDGKTENEAIGIVISEFGNLDELGDTLGIQQVLDNKSEISVVSYEDAKRYIEDSRETAPKTAFGVLLCILCPVVLLLLIGLSENNMVSAKEDILIAIGIVILLCMVASGVYFFIRYSSNLEKYEIYQNDIFTLDYRTEQMVRMVKEQEEKSYKATVSISVISYILSPLPLILTGLLAENEELSIFGLIVTLIIVAIATYNLINKGGALEACSILLQEGDYSAKKKSKAYKTVQKVYWSVIVAIYLAYSFITYNWAMSWIIWPVAGVLFAAVSAVLENK